MNQKKEVTQAEIDACGKEHKELRVDRSKKELEATKAEKVGITQAIRDEAAELARQDPQD